jgi:hypothetical protein
MVHGCIKNKSIKFRRLLHSFTLLFRLVLHFNINKIIDRKTLFDMFRLKFVK